MYNALFSEELNNLFFNGASFFIIKVSVHNFAVGKALPTVFNLLKSLRIGNLSFPHFSVRDRRLL